MSTMVKLISVIAMSAGMSGVTVLPASALSIISPAYEDQSVQTTSTYSNPPVAFTGGAGQAGNSAGLSLSSEEIQHISWCARNHTSYHATDNTIESRQGGRTECKSPY